MNWDAFFARTLEASGLSSYSQLAPKLGISDGAISHYRTGKRVPQVWVVAEALKVQGHPSPEKAAIEIMKAAALTSPERTFWKRLAASTALLALAFSFSLDTKAETLGYQEVTEAKLYIMRSYVEMPSDSRRRFYDGLPSRCPTVQKHVRPLGTRHRRFLRLHGRRLLLHVRLVAIRVAGLASAGDATCLTLIHDHARPLLCLEVHTAPLPLARDRCSRRRGGFAGSVPTPSADSAQAPC